ncbi:hypothetical protein ACSTS3_08915 [Aquimarina muelleri]|uniref:hypothetical protein n=1 Tax=Aquimarina muelleri TaxID=279356 RepID=UPI003F683230
MMKIRREIVVEKINKYKYILIGLIIAITGYTYTLLINWDIINNVNVYLSFTKKYGLDEAFFIWIFCFLFFMILNLVESFKRKIYLQKKKAYLSMLDESNHMIKKLLYQLQIIRMEAKNSPNFDKQVLRMFDTSIEDAVTMLNKLSDIKKIDKDHIFKKIKPKERSRDQKIKIDLFGY